MESNLAMIKRQIDRMIEYRKLNRPNDESDLRCTATAKEIHMALEKPLPPGVDRKRCTDLDFPVTCLYRGFRVTSIVTEKKIKERDAKMAPKPPPCECHAPGGYPHEPDCPLASYQHG